MITEGKGRHAPKPIQQALDHHVLWLCFDSASRISRNREYQNSTDQWKQGLTGSLYIPKVGLLPRDMAPRFVGNAGEAAIVCFLNDRAGASFSLDDRLLSAGDGGVDLDIWGMSTQVKTRQSNKSHAREHISLVRHATESGRIVFPTATIIVCCELCVATGIVSLLGWIYSVRASRLPPAPARCGNHQNIEIPDCDLQPMAAFVDLVVARKELVL